MIESLSYEQGLKKSLHEPNISHMHRGNSCKFEPAIQSRWLLCYHNCESFFAVEIAVILEYLVLCLQESCAGLSSYFFS